MSGLLDENKRVVVDFNHLVFRNFFMCRGQYDALEQDSPGTGFSFLKYQIYQSLFYICGQFGPTEMVLALDGRKNWRKKYYYKYKANRDEKRKEDNFDWPGFFDRLAEFEKEIQQNLPFKVIRNEFLEADDVAGWFAREKNDCETVLISSDKDWIQLTQYPNINLWDPIKKKMLKVNDPEKDLLIKVLQGDKGDNVPPVKKGIGPKRAERLVGSEGFEKFKEENQEEYRRNRVLIDLRFTPKKLLKSLKETYDEYEMPVQDLKHLYRYFSENRLKRFSDSLERIEKNLSSLVF